MAYSLKYNGKHQESVQINNISGFFVALPFDFDANQNMVLHPERAAAIVRVVMTRSPKIAFPTYSQNLPNQGNYELLDEHGSVKVSLNSFSRTHIISSQSADLSQSLWLFNGDQSADCEVNSEPFKSKPPFHLDGPQHYSWDGDLKDGNDKTLLKPAYSEFNIDISKNNLTKSMMTFGPAGSHAGSVPLMTWLTEQGSWLIEDSEQVAKPTGKNALDKLVLHDNRRNTQLNFFGASDEGKAQADNAEGVVFLLQGGMGLLQPYELRKLIRQSTKGQDGLDELSDFDALNIIQKTCSDTAKENPKDVLNKDETVLEGLALWNLQARKNDSNDIVDPAEAIFL